MAYSTKLIPLSWVKIKYKAWQMHDGTLREKCPNTELFLVRIWTLFTQWYSGTETSSDHRIVETLFQVQWSKLHQKKSKQLYTSKLNAEKLKDPLTKELYQQTLTEKERKEV